MKLGRQRWAASEATSLVDPAKAERRNFIDDAIYGALQKQGVKAAAKSADDEFIRRVTLDLAGHLPTSTEIKEFMANTSSAKRDELIDKLLASPEFTDKWTMWFGDLLQNTAFTLSTQAVPRRVESRNAYQKWIARAVASGKPIRDMAWEAIAASGNSFDPNAGQVNFTLGGQAAMGPAQDSYDMMMVKATTAFLGLAHYDCLSCHSGRGHLESLSYWGRQTQRMDAWKMAAFFSRTRWTTNNKAADLNVSPMYDSVDLADAATGTYDLNTNSGNRPGRCSDGAPLDEKTGRCAKTASLTPTYRDGAAPSNGNWRAAFATNLTKDPMFARNFANRLWKAMFNLGLVDPVDTLDPLRLDPANPPPEPYALQATNPELLERLAAAFNGNNSDLRQTLRIIAQSNAYQMSSRYDGEWKYEYTPLFARHYPRRLDAEEIADALAKFSGNQPRITWALASRNALPVGAAIPQSDPVFFTMQLPDTQEGGTAAAFLNIFLRGNRDTQLRTQNGSILQQLGLMNDSYVLQRVKLATAPNLKAISGNSNNDIVVDELFFNILGRRSSDAEHRSAVATLNKATSTALRNTAIEDLAWSLVNKTEFIFSY